MKLDITSRPLSDMIQADLDTIAYMTATAADKAPAPKPYGYTHHCEWIGDETDRYGVAA